ncbi:unnamed protein product [Blepharisma stoltei]|uniref:Uncharacterized protein n=1 Tax=Blepharisma stoltei TaxID=1481888 RepID=A0AAU9IJT8_9CILI|nr:unnamed protein product [Blepharisma stoltei]
MISDELQHYLNTTKDKRSGIIKLAQDILKDSNSRFSKKKHFDRRIKKSSPEFHYSSRKIFEEKSAEIIKSSDGDLRIIDYSNRQDRSFITPTTKNQVLNSIYSRESPTQIKQVLASPLSRLRRYKVMSPDTSSSTISKSSGLKPPRSNESNRLEIMKKKLSVYEQSVLQRPSTHRR